MATAVDVGPEQAIGPPFSAERAEIRVANPLGEIGPFRNQKGSIGAM